MKAGLLLMLVWPTVSPAQVLSANRGLALIELSSSLDYQPVSVTPAALSAPLPLDLSQIPNGGVVVQGLQMSLTAQQALAVASAAGMLGLRRLGAYVASKHAVIGKAHRLDWPARPSPIKNRWPDSTTRPPPQPGQPRVPPVTLAPLPSLSAPATREPIVIPEPPPRPPPPKPVFVAPPKPAAAPAPKYGRVVPCCWPLTDRSHLIL